MKCHVSIQLSTIVCHILTKKITLPFSFSSFPFPLFPSFSFCYSLPHFLFFPGNIPPPSHSILQNIYPWKFRSKIYQLLRGFFPAVKRVFQDVKFSYTSNFEESFNRFWDGDAFNVAETVWNDPILNLLQWNDPFSVRDKNGKKPTKENISFTHFLEAKFFVQFI